MFTNRYKLTALIIVFPGTFAARSDNFGQVPDQTGWTARITAGRREKGRRPRQARRGGCSWSVAYLTLSVSP